MFCPENCQYWQEYNNGGNNFNYCGAPRGFKCVYRDHQSQIVNGNGCLWIVGIGLAISFVLIMYAIFGGA